MEGERRDDWRQGVDQNLASLNAGQRVHDAEISRLWKAHVTDDKILRGDPDQDTDGMIARLHAQENEINMLKAVVLRDALGGNGLVDRVEALETGDKKADRRWQFSTVVLAAAISFLGVVVSHWSDITAYVQRSSQDPLERKIEAAKHRRKRPIPQPEAQTP